MRPREKMCPRATLSGHSFAFDNSFNEHMCCSGSCHTD